MIHPRPIWALPESTDAEKRAKGKAQADNDKAVLKLSTEIADAVVGAAPFVAAARVQSISTGYARALAVLLRHLRVGPTYKTAGDRWEAVHATVLEAHSRFWVAPGVKDLPPPLHLLVRSHYAYVFPGGEELQWYFQLTNFVFRPFGSLGEFEFSCALFDRWWNDTNTRIAWEIKKATPPEKLSQADRFALEVMDEPKQTQGSREWADLITKPDGAKKWDEISRWVTACRAKVPVIKVEE